MNKSYTNKKKLKKLMEVEQNIGKLLEVTN